MKNIKVTAAFISSETEIKLQSAMIAVSAEKQELQSKNFKARLRTLEKFNKASEQALDLIVKHSSEQALERLMNPSNYKTSQRVLDVANKLTRSDKYSSIIDYASIALDTFSAEKISVDHLCVRSKQCYSRISNAVKALYFFDLIEVSNASTDSNFIVKMSKDTLITKK